LLSAPSLPPVLAPSGSSSQQNDFLKALGYKGNSRKGIKEGEEPSVLMRLGPEAAAFALKVKEAADSEAAAREQEDEQSDPEGDRDFLFLTGGAQAGPGLGGRYGSGLGAPQVGGGTATAQPAGLLQRSKSRSNIEPLSLASFQQSTAFDEVRLGNGGQAMVRPLRPPPFNMQIAKGLRQEQKMNLASNCSANIRKAGTSILQFSLACFPPLTTYGRPGARCVAPPCASAL
jgi:hypothetical protein